LPVYRKLEVIIRAHYRVIAFTPSTPAIAVTTATATFKIILHTDFLIAIIPHLLSTQLKKMIVTEWKSQFPAHFEARTLLNPFFRLYHSVTVQVRTEVTMPADTDIVPKAFQELMHKQPERRALFRRTGIFGTPPDIKTALIADAYRVRIMALGMRPDKFQSTGIDYRAILTDVVVIADTAEATATVIFLQFGHSQRTVFACGGTVNNDVIDCSHVT
jgi:hypothetical protein